MAKFKIDNLEYDIPEKVKPHSYRLSDDTVNLINQLFKRFKPLKQDQIVNLAFNLLKKKLINKQITQQKN